MKKITLPKLYYKIVFTIILTLNFTAYAQYADCSTALVVRGNTQPFNPSGIGNKLEQLACGGVEHNSVWIAFQAKASGKLNFVIRPFSPDGLPSAADVDWSLFALSGAPGVANCDSKTQLSCNYSGATTGFGISGATGMATPNFNSTSFNPGVDVVSGNWYTLIVDQFSNATPLLFSIQFTGNIESPNLNSSPGIFDDAPNFSFTTSGCSGNYNFTNSSTAVSGIASYLWNFGDGTTSTLPNPTKTYLTSGTYYVTLTTTDSFGFKTDIRRTLIYNAINPPVVTTAGIFATPSCSNSNNGTLTVTSTGATTTGVSGGTPPYTYELVSPSPIVVASQVSNNFTNLQAGTYTVKVTDACGRSATNTVTIAQVVTNSTIGIVAGVLQSSCVSSPTGSVILTINGTTPPYTAALVNSSPLIVGPQPTVQRDATSTNYYATFNNLPAGVYTTEVTDACGKIRRFFFTINQSTTPVVTIVPSASCANGATGTISISSTSGNGYTSTGSPGTFQFALINPSPVIRPYQNASVFENLLPGVYRIAVKDFCGTVGLFAATVLTAGLPVFGATFTSPSCPNGTTGSIEAQISSIGGGGPYTFELITPSPIIRISQNNNLFSNLSAGTYTIKLTDVCGNFVTTTTTVATAIAPTFTTAVTTSCFAPQNGTITVTPNALAIGPFSFELISPGAAIRVPQSSNIANSTNSIFTGLAQGNYTVKMIDGCGTPVTAVVSVGAPTALVFPTGSTVTPSCSISATGSLTVTAPTTGSAPYLYSLIAPSPVTVANQSSRIFNNLPTGSYTIKITDACGTQVTIGTPLVIAATAAPVLTATNTSSCATASGTITALASNSNTGGGYQFALIAPSPVTRPNQLSPFFAGLVAGIYTVQITDQCGAVGTVTSTITAAAAFTIAAGGSVVSCAGSSYNAQIIVTTPQNFTSGGPIPAGSGGGPYTYAVYDSANTTLIAGPQSSNVFSTIVPLTGTPTHTVRVTDACGTTATVAITLNPPAALTAGVIGILAYSCAATNTGQIAVTASTGGLPPYSYSLIDAVTLAVIAPPQTGINFENVPVNATNGYFVRTIDACGNQVTSTTALLLPAAVTPTATVTTIPSCAGSPTGRITISPTSGNTLAGGTFSYSLYNAANTVLITGPQSSPVFNAVAAATYTVRLTDRCGTVGTVAATVSSTVTTLTAAGTASGTCTAGSSGSISATSTGGSLPVTFTLLNSSLAVLSGPQTNSVFTNLAAATYVIKVTDACGTTINSSNIVLGNLTTAPTITTTLALACGSGSILTGYATGGSNGPFTYAICSGAGCTTFSGYSTNNQFPIATSGTYRISALDRCGNAVSSADVVISSLPQAQIITLVKDIACGPTTLTLTTSNIPNTPYYSVDGGNFSPSIGTLAIGIHSIVVCNYNAGSFGCASAASTVDVGAKATWDGTQWVGGINPSTTLGVSFTGNYSTPGNITACFCSVSNGAVVVRPTGSTTTLTDEVTVSGLGSSLTFENNAPLVQTNPSTSINTGNIVVKRNSAALMRLDYTLWSSPVTGAQTLVNFSPLTFNVGPNNIRFYTYDVTNNFYTKVLNAAATTFTTGKGYLIRTPDNHPTTPTIWNGQFTGVPTNGSFTVPITYISALQKFNAIGNPYPSPISLTSFLAANTANIENTFYFWRKTNSLTTNTGYSTWTSGVFTSGPFFTSSSDPLNVLQTGQGFMVQAKLGATNVSFNNTMRLTDTANQFFKTTTTIDERHFIWLNLTGNNQQFSQIAVGYRTNATNDVDDLDGMRLADASTNLNSYLNNQDYVIQSRALPFNISDLVPLNLKVPTAGNFTIAIDHLEGLFVGGSQPIYLHDLYTNTYTNLNTTAYTFATEAGSFNNRFEIVYDTVLKTTLNISNENGLVVYKNNGSIIVNSGSSILLNIKIFDTRGRLLLEKNDINSNEISLNIGDTNQVVLVKTTLFDGQIVTKKLIN